MEIINATEEEIKALKQMARVWMKENFEFLKTIKEYPSYIHKDKPTYYELLAGEQVYLTINRLRRNRNDCSLSQ